MRKRASILGKAHLAKEQEYHERARSLCIETHFNEQECVALLKIHANLMDDSPLDRMQFRGLLFQALRICDTFILDRIFRVVDQNDNGVVDGDEFIRCLSTMMRGSLEELTTFCYDVYDVNGDRSLAREELFMCLDGSLRPGRGILDKDELNDSVKDLVEIAMRKLDVNMDGQITYDDFREAVRMDPLMIQVCGQCLPPTRCSEAFLYLLTTTHKNISPILPAMSTSISRSRRTLMSNHSVSSLRSLRGD